MELTDCKEENGEIPYMKQLFLNVKDGSMKLIDQPMPTVKENMALVETLYTVVSAGTERGLASAARIWSRRHWSVRIR